MILTSQPCFNAEGSFGATRRKVMGACRKWKTSRTAGPISCTARPAWLLWRAGKAVVTLLGMARSGRRRVYMGQGGRQMDLEADDAYRTVISRSGMQRDRSFRRTVSPFESLPFVFNFFPAAVEIVCLDNFSAIQPVCQ